MLCFTLIQSSIYVKIYIKSCNLATNIHLDEVIFVKFFPKVSMTRLPSVHNPKHIPALPKNNKNHGVVRCVVATYPSWNISHIPISGPIELLYYINLL